MLEKVQDSRIVSDSENVMGLPNYEGFIDNRHDQTVLSLLAKNGGLFLFVTHLNGEMIIIMQMTLL